MADAVYAVVIEPRRVMEPPPSDRLFGALAWATVWLYPDDRWFVEKPHRFVISSAFPVIHGVRYWPKPILPPVRLEPAAEARSLKKVRYVSESIWTAWIDGEAPLESWAERVREETWRIHASGLALATREEVPRSEGSDKVMYTEPMPHARIDRMSMATVPSGTLYFEEATFVARGVRFWFAVRMESEDLPILKALMRFLEDRGIGGNRSVGMNHFRLVSIQPLEQPWWSLRSRRWVNLSVFIPASDELDWDGPISYEAIPSRPRAESEGPLAGQPLKRAFLYWMEGSVVTARKAQPYYGHTLTMRVLPDGSRLIHSGLALPAFLPPEA